MSITVNWFDPEHTIIHYDFEGQWSWGELNEVVNQVNEMVRSVGHRVDVIIDVTNGQSTPSGAFSQIQGITAKAPDNWGMGVFVGASGLVRVLVTTFLKIYPRFNQRYALTDTVAEALDIIRERRDDRSEN